MNLPNAITIGRIFLVPLLVVVLLTQFEGRLILGIRKELVGAAIFGLASLTDWLDDRLGAAVARSDGEDHIPQFVLLGTIALWIAMVTAVVSAFDYYRRFNHVLSESGSRL